MTKTSIGVVIVTFNAADVILDCLESLLAARNVDLRIVLVDNASTDTTVETLRSWASGQMPYTAPDDIPFALAPCPKPLPLNEVQPETPAEPAREVTLLHSGMNRGFAGGVNLGLAYLSTDPEIDHFWVLNPDGIVPPDSPAALAQTAADNPDYDLISGRVCYLDPPDMIQIDGGTINWWSGVTHNIGLGASHATTAPPDAATKIEFVTGASLLASRAFYQAVGPMKEDYFLYYEEVDWACRRKDRKVDYADGALIYHRAGTAIGSPTLARIASTFSMYFKYRSRMLVIRRFNPKALPVTYLYAMAKAGQILLKGAWREAWALFVALHGMAPPKEVRTRLSAEALALIRKD